MRVESLCIIALWILPSAYSRKDSGDGGSDDFERLQRWCDWCMRTCLAQMVHPPNTLEQIAMIRRVCLDDCNIHMRQANHQCEGKEYPLFNLRSLPPARDPSPDAQSETEQIPGPDPGQSRPRSPRERLPGQPPPDQNRPSSFSIENLLRRLWPPPSFFQPGRGGLGGPRVPMNFRPVPIF